MTDKPDESRLLTANQQKEIERPFDDDEVGIQVLADAYLMAQDAKTASILEAEHQRMVEELFEEIEEMLAGVLNPDSEEWLELKARYRNQTKGSKEC